MYQALNDLVDLLTHKNVDILSVTCQLIEVTANYDENLRIMIDAGVIDNLANLVPTVGIFLALILFAGACTKNRTLINTHCLRYYLYYLSKSFVKINDFCRIISSRIPFFTF